MDETEIEHLLGIDWNESDLEEGEEDQESMVEDILEGRLLCNEIEKLIGEDSPSSLCSVSEDLPVSNRKVLVGEENSHASASKNPSVNLTINDEPVPGPSSSPAQCEAPEPDVSSQGNSNGLQKPARKTRKEKFTWRKVNFQNPCVEWKGSLPPPPDDEFSPLQYFKMLIDDDIIEHICTETNKYAHQKDGTVLGVTKDEIEKYFGILLHMGIVDMAFFKMYWAHDCRYPPIADTMGRNRFESIKKYFHINDNTKQKLPGHEEYDKLFKVRPLIDSLRKNLLLIPPEERHAIDEQVIPFKGRSVLKQYNKSKPHKWGFKVFMRASSTGMMHDFVIYVGKGTCPSKELGLSGDVVAHLVSSLPENQNFKIYFDNWFASVGLVKYLKDKGMWSIGTIRSDRMGNCPLLSQDELKKEGRGSYDWRVETNLDINIVRWLDSKAVQLISSYCGVNPTNTCKRYSHKDKVHIEVIRPNIVQEYNLFMGGVDLADMLIELYRIDLRSNKWYTRIVFWCLNAAVVTAWLLYRRHEKQRQKKPKDILTLVQFQSRIATGLTSFGKVPERKRGRPSQEGPEKKRRCSNEMQPNADVRYDEVGHLPDYVESKKRCKLCIKGVTTVICKKCKIHLCFVPTRNCFLHYHTR